MTISDWISRAPSSLEDGGNASSEDYLFNPTLIPRSHGYDLVCRRVRGIGQSRRFFGFRRARNEDPRRELIVFRTSRLGDVLPGPVPTISDELTRISDGVTWWADPRYFLFHDQDYISCNTGHSERPNTIYIVRLDGSSSPVGPILRAEKTDGRAPIEKNWGFFEAEGRLYAVYTLHPLVVMECRLEGRVASCRTAYVHDWRANEFEEAYGPLHGGPSPVRIGEKFYCITQSWTIGPAGRRYYVSILSFQARAPFRPLEFAFGPVMELTPEEERLRPQRRLNPRVDSCIYPTGCVYDAVDDSVAVAYGINDYRWGLRRYRRDALLRSLKDVTALR